LSTSPPARPALPPRTLALRTALTLALGTVGGWIFYRLNLPLPWMLGAMSAATLGSLAGLRLDLPRWLRNSFITVLGVLLGSRFTPEVLAQMGEWALTISGMLVWAATVTAISVVYFRRVARYDAATALFSATPGGFNEMIVVGSQMGADVRLIALTHATRVIIVVFAIPFWYRFETGIVAGGRDQPHVGLGDVPVGDLALLAACAVVGALIARRYTRIPAGSLMVPMLLSVAIHLASLTSSEPPYVLVAVAQVVVGSAAGARFTGMPLRMVGVAAIHSAVTAVFMLAVTVGFCVALAAVTGLPIASMVLAYAPGGLAEMSLIALALGLDAAFVATHHIFRIIAVVTLAPLGYRLTGGRSRPPPGD